MKNYINILFFFIFLTFTIIAKAVTPQGWQAITVSYGIGHNLSGYQTSWEWQPQQLVWSAFSVYSDLSLGHWDADSSHHHSLNIIAATPVLRYTFASDNYFNPYLEAGAGIGLRSQTHLGNLDLGSHGCFQLLAGAGTTFGIQQQFDLSLHFVHYSNAYLVLPNDSINIKALISVGYRFS